MPLKIRILIVGWFLFAPYFGQSEIIVIDFYTDQITTQFDPGMVTSDGPEMDDLAIISYYKKIADLPYQLLLEGLQQKKQELKLNDWLYYELISASIQTLLKDHSELKKNLYCWLLLSKSNFDTRLTFQDKQVFLNVWTDESVFETPFIRISGKKYINISSLRNKGQNNKQDLNLLLFEPQKAGKAFSFRLDQLPVLSADVKEDQLSFTWRDSLIQLNISTDQTVNKIMKHYPMIDERAYLEVPLSSTVSSSLVPQLKKLLKNKTTIEALELLVSFTRRAFDYKEDRAHFGKGKPMIADEVFHYPYSDCEDRSALFYCLVKELLDLPMIIVAYPDHLTIAVSHKDLQGSPIHYNNRNYYICDPTGPSESERIGWPPYGYESQEFEILGQYR